MDKLTYRVSKRCFDYLVSALLIVIVSPVILLVAVVIKITSKGPVLYCQKRVGKYGKEFNMYKFRTMVINAEAILQDKINKDADFRAEWEKYQSVARDPRITKIGKILRRTSLDELPQLLNVLKGDMSLVGARPITADQIKMFNEGFSYYILSRPGLTGLYQVNGRNNLTFEQRIEIDTKYIKEKNFILDIMILLKTFRVVISGDGAT
ncbi:MULTISPECIES: sugar transferase [Klebsiella pneumoniae complex]|jgi:exopolysaccharide production protein ExoY|uniref:sugar transferase n=1 Tax=Klebsiella pneumoniae complex TaxID=3390273 RepID=UPI0007CBC7F5|nr:MULTISPECIES: sugar transferase [Klebsiella]HBT3078006.1 sugar transferase [Klebsiella pneumoniae]HBW1560027.1 sugar transferase [Klebsiella quasipneumoniae subsp. similipneumoniae]MDV0911312.1 sugar transferase [Klebsiella variicola subsp. variicola]SAY21066.1 UDP-Gal::undecaprenolphosphate Gal-1-P transferase [Klebsiella quasipneumoniae]HCM4310147.1 sugar transferase [Klebsiella quasipneumoniae subsp. similipneumoniae]